MPVPGREKVQEGKREPPRLSLRQNLQVFLVMVFKSLSFSPQNPASKSHVMAVTTLVSDVERLHNNCFPSLCFLLNQSSSPQGHVDSTEAPGEGSTELEGTLATTLSNPLILYTERESD